MGQPAIKVIETEVAENADQLSEETLALIDHIGEILAEEYVKLMKQEEKDEGSHIRKILK